MHGTNLNALDGVGGRPRLNSILELEAAPLTYLGSLACLVCDP